jgi:hypothetical protein
MENMDNNLPSTMSFEHWGEKVSITKPNSDIAIVDFWEMCKTIARAAGYAESSIKEYFDE